MIDGRTSAEIAALVAARTALRVPDDVECSRRFDRLVTLYGRIASEAWRLASIELDVDEPRLS